MLWFKPGFKLTRVNQRGLWLSNLLSTDHGWKFSVAATQSPLLLSPLLRGHVLSIDRNVINKQRVLMHGHQGWNVRHGLCRIYMIYVYIWVVYSFCLFCCLFIIVTTQFVALYKPCKPKPKPSTYDPPRAIIMSTRTWQTFNSLLN